MNLAPFTGPGSTPSRRRFWDQVTQAVIASQKVAGRFVTVDEHPGKGSVINVANTSSRRPTPPVTSGACCIDGECSILSESDCTDGGGNYLGVGSTCDDVDCTTGVCCFDADCYDIFPTQEECEGEGGIFYGGTTCDPNPCPFDPCTCAFSPFEGGGTTKYTTKTTTFTRTAHQITGTTDCDLEDDTVTTETCGSPGAIITSCSGTESGIWSEEPCMSTWELGEFGCHMVPGCPACATGECEFGGLGFTGGPTSPTTYEATCHYVHPTDDIYADATVSIELSGPVTCEEMSPFADPFFQNN